MSLRANILNSLYTKVALLLLGVVSTVIYTRILGPESYGQGILLLLFPPITIHLTSLGIPGSLSYFVGQDPSRAKTVVGTALCFALLQSVLSTLALYALADWLWSAYYDSGVDRDLLLLALSITPFQAAILFFAQVLKAQELIKALNLTRELLPVVLRLAAVIVFVGVLDWGVQGLVIAEVVVSVLIAAIMVVVLHSHGLLTFGFDRKLFGRMLHYGARSYFESLSGAFAPRLDQLLLGALLSASDVGIYAIAQNLAKKLLFVFAAIATPLLPRMARLSKQEAAALARRVLDLMLLPGIGAVVVSVLFFPFVVDVLYGPAFVSAFSPFVPLALSSMFASLVLVVTTYFVSHGRPGVKSLQKLGTLVIHTVVLVSLVPRFGMLGAGLGSLLGQSAAFFGFYAYYKRSASMRGVRVFTFSYRPVAAEIARMFGRAKS